MTNKFDSKDDAKAYACKCIGAGIEVFDGVIPENSEMYNPLDIEMKYPEKIEIYTITHKDKKLLFAIGKFRDGYDLWLMAENGMSIRV